MATTGQSWDQVRNDWDLPRLEAWNTYCQSHPTVRDMVQAYLRIEPKKKAVASLEETLDILRQFPGAVELPST